MNDKGRKNLASIFFVCAGSIAIVSVLRLIEWGDKGNISPWLDYVWAAAEPICMSLALLAVAFLFLACKFNK